ncbi:TlpA disulfide reductase family protein [Actinoalloteichus hymeniacidonis]|uniref:Thiol-disulfide isomerase-like thioredoxin n=1 Tax=Actinoalloteichus hymeniacidonis TaxID=340345 RepID=A0AAC9HLZ3_9PSEU|nr:TlpA disulfide reductase family protein [Actinoalloteichus hymeniacidonis]AOS61325.1 thiol-disulfide isomerase-like thioredoxin [Actinoalloteichus hymeniacidonis]MBB5910670.1 thiol-disulfide isomerase/thioredoxin [Actinoalloteichus hymeniacidonis]
MIRRSRLVGLLGVALLTLSACTGLEQTDDVPGSGRYQFVAPGGETRIRYDEAERQVAPEISGDDLMNEGEPIGVSDFEGDVVVLNIWGSWCGPCRLEAEHLQYVYEETAEDGVAFLGINVRDHVRSAPMDFTSNLGITYPSIYDPAGRSLLGMRGYPRSAVPSTIILDRQHRVAAVFLAEVLTEDLLPVVEEIAAEQ